MQLKYSARKKLNAGSTLIEVLITLLVVSVGLLGMAALQLRSISLNQSAYFQLQATNLAADIADRILVNGEQASKDYYKKDVSQVLTDINAAANEVTKQDISEWLTKASVLPQGQFSIGPITGTDQFIHTHKVTVCWTDKTVPKTLQAAECANQKGKRFVQIDAVSRI